MFLTVTNPFYLADRLRREFWKCCTEEIRATVRAEDDKYVITAEVPGLNEDEIDLSFSEKTLAIKVSREKGDEKDERSAAWFLEDADGDAIEASLDKGILTVTVPKAKDKQPKKIEIKCC